MACRIVDGFEAIEIDKDQGMTLARFANGLQEAFEMIFEADPVCQMGQGVVGGAVAQLTQHFARLGHILNHDNRANILPVQRAERRNAVVNIKITAGTAVQHHVLIDIGTGHIAAVNILHQRPFFTKGDVQHLQDRLADSLGLQPAAHFLGHRVHKGDVHVDIGTQHRFTDGVEGDVQTLFFLEEGLVELLHLGHIHVDPEQPFDFTLLIEHPVCQGANMAHAFLHADAEFQLKRQAGNQRVPQHLLGVGTIFRQHRVVPELPGRLDVRRDFI